MEEIKNNGSVSLKICETYISIQGESSYAGLPCYFIRLTGCNLRCLYCDTTYAYTEGREWGLEEIIAMVKGSGARLVEITGGEPLLQKETLDLTGILCDEGYQVLIETNGSIDIQGVDRRAAIILDIKTPGSGMSKKMHLDNLKKLRWHDEVKFVITDRRDYNWSKKIIERFKLSGGNILFSPAFGFLDPEVLIEWIISDRLNVRLNLQLHKYIFSGRMEA